MKKILILGGVGAMAGETTMDLVNTSEFDEIMVADIDIAKAESVTAAMKDERLRVVKVNAESVDETAKLMSGYDVVANGLPRAYCENAIKAAIVAKVDMLDLVSPHEETLALDSEAKAAQISVVGGVGITPGITNILAKLGADRAGIHTRTISLETVSPGVYLYRVTLDGKTHDGKLVVTR